VFKKYSPMGELASFAAQYADVMSRACGVPVLIADRDRIVAAAGVPKREFLERRLSEQLEQYMENRRQFIATATETTRFFPAEGSERQASVCFPIISAGDVTGAVCLMLPESGALPGEGDIKLTQVAAGFLGKQMEE